MREFIDTLEKILSAAAGFIELLPASGGAIEDMTFTDHLPATPSKVTTAERKIPLIV